MLVGVLVRVGVEVGEGVRVGKGVILGVEVGTRFIAVSVSCAARVKPAAAVFPACLVRSTNTVFAASVKTLVGLSEIPGRVSMEESQPEKINTNIMLMNNTVINLFLIISHPDSLMENNI